jgi:NADH-quinone oxidoreductase subunit J
MTAVFSMLAVITIAGAVAAMTLRNPVHSVLALVLAFTGLSTLYLSLGAQFVGFAQILIYIGAVSILIVFVILLTRSSETAEAVRAPRSWIAGLVIAAVVFGLLGRSILGSSVARQATTGQPGVAVKQIGEALMGPFVLPLEVLALLLTAALVGAVIVAVDDRKIAR